jgi:hypothetical protein
MDKPLEASRQTPVPVQVARVEPLRPLLWLKLGWEDISHNRGPASHMGYSWSRWDG